jgi:hypothetical protein
LYDRFRWKCHTLQKIIFPLSVATGSTRPKNREQSFEINSFRIIYAQKSGTIFRNQFFSNNLWDVSTRWRQKAGILFSGGYDISSGNCHNDWYLVKFPVAIKAQGSGLRTTYFRSLLRLILAVSPTRVFSRVATTRVKCHLWHVSLLHTHAYTEHVKPRMRRNKLRKPHLNLN